MQAYDFVIAIAEPICRYSLRSACSCMRREGGSQAGWEAGAQGEHKLARGYLPTQTHSLHWIGHPGFAEAVERFLKAERAAVEEDIEILTAYGPFKKIHVEEQE